MEILFLLIGTVLLAFPMIAIAALARTFSLRSLSNERHLEYQDTISALRQQLATVHRLLAELSERMAQQKTMAVDPESAAAPQGSTVPSPEPAPQVAEVKIAASATIDLPPQFSTKAPPRRSEHETAKEEPARFDAPSEPATRTAPPRETSKTDPPRPPPATFQAHFGRTPQVSTFSIPLSAPRKSVIQNLREMLPLEDFLSMNLFAKVGIVLLVLGFALLGKVALVAMGPGGKVALLYAVSITLLAGGMSLERKERYRLIGRTGIGGGWAMLFFTTYAMHHVAAMKVMNSDLLSSVFLLAVSAVMTTHTLRYRSQLVSGLAFLLAFSTVALSQDTVYALSAGVILAIGIATIALRMDWYELEVFGIIASYANHLYWLYRLFPGGIAGHAFPEFLPSTIILVLYWLVFRLSYVVRHIHSPRDEHISTLAALSNTVLLLVAMRFQSTRPELAFHALVAFGGLEFFFGQLPRTRRRRPAFILLTALGSLLILASVPFRFSGNNIGLLWMIAAEALLVAGIAQAEVVFRRLGLLTGVITGALIIYDAQRIIEFRQHSEARLVQDGVLLLTCSALFYINSHFIRARWQRLFADIDDLLAKSQSYVGVITAFLGVWALMTKDWTALGWAVLMLGAALGTRLLNDSQILIQAWALVIAVTIRTALVNSHLSDPFPHHVGTRILTLPILAGTFYASAAALPGAREESRYLRSIALGVGSSLMVMLVWLEVTPAWVAPIWLGFAVALTLASRGVRLTDLAYQGHLLAILVLGLLLNTNLHQHSVVERYLPIIGSAAAYYALSRICTLRDAPYARYAAWAYSWSGTVLLAALAWQDSPQLWIACLWATFALALATVDRIFHAEELPWQAHTFALLAVCRATTLNLFTREQWHRIDLRLLTVSILVCLLYALARWIRIRLRETGMHHAYSWAASILAACMLWNELGDNAVAVGLAVFGLALLECGLLRKQKQLRMQAYAVLVAAFLRTLFVNLAAPSIPGDLLGPHIHTVLPVVLVYAFLWWQLRRSKVSERESQWAGGMFAWLGTVSLIGLLYREITPEWIIVGWAVAVMLLMGIAVLFEEELILQQAVLLVIGITVGGLVHNVFGANDFPVRGWFVGVAPVMWTAAVLFTALPFAFRLRNRYASRPTTGQFSRLLGLAHPEQWLFFAPVVLVTLAILVRINPGMLTLSWGLEGLSVILLGLILNQRSYRITGLILLLLCVCKIGLLDAWQLNERDRYVTFIALGTALTLVSVVYNKYRDSMKRLL